MSRKSTQIRHNNLFLLFLVYVLYSIASVFEKIAALQTDRLHMVLYIGLEFLSLFAFALLWIQVLRQFDVIVASSMKGVTVVYSLIFSALLFKERVSIGDLAGCLLVVIGMYIFAKDD